MRAVIYCRVSTERQAKENESLPFQRKSCRDFCQQNGWEVAEVFTDAGESAKTIDRPELVRMIEYCARNKGKVHVAVVHTLSRFSRETLDHKTLRVLLQSYGVTLRSVSEPIDDTPEGEFMEHIISGVAQYENRQRARRTVAGMKNKLNDGGWSFKAPLGYKNTLTPDGKKTISPDPDRAQLVREAFETYATGLHTKEEVLRIVNRKGMRGVGGKRLAGETFNRMLKNPLYAGIVSVKGWDVAKRGSFEPIISEETFERVQAVLSGRKVSVTPRKRHNPDFPLRHFVRCGNCDKPLTGSRSKGRNAKYPYYHCPNKKCERKVSIRGEKMERQFVEFLEQLRPREEFLRLFRAVVLDVWNNKQSEATEIRTALEKKLKGLQDRKQTLNSAFVYDRAIDRADYQQMKAQLDAELFTAEVELHEARENELDMEGVVAFAERVLLDAPHMWQLMSSDQKQRFQQALFPEGVQFSDGAYRTATTCFAFNGLQTELPNKEELVAIPGFEPGSAP